MATHPDDKMIPLGTVEGLYDFTPSDLYGLPFKRGDVITVFQCLDTGWWDGSCGGKRGWFPSNFTTKLNEKESDGKKDWVPQKSSSGETYYYNKTTGHSSWERPNSSGDEELPERRGSLDLFIPSSIDFSGSVRQTDQRLPPNWSAHESEQGLTFYYNSETKKIQWTFPEVKEEPKIVEDDQKLPENWGEKILPDGRVYYYHMETNETTWKRPDGKGLRRSQTAPEKKAIEQELETQLAFEIPEKPGVIRQPWVQVTQGVFAAFSDLSEAGNANKKEFYVGATKAIIQAIQVLFICTDTLSPNSPHLQKSKKLALHYREINDGLSKLVLASKLASGVWPPPDAVARVQQTCIEIVLVLRHFITQAIELGIQISGSIDMPARVFKPPVKPKPAMISTKHNSGGATAPSFIPTPTSSMPPVLSPRPPDIPSKALKPKLSNTPSPLEIPSPVDSRAMPFSPVRPLMPRHETKPMSYQAPAATSPTAPAPATESAFHAEEAEASVPGQAHRFEENPDLAPSSRSSSSLMEEETHENVPAEEQTDAIRIADLDVYSKQVLRFVERLIDSIRRFGIQRGNDNERDAMFVQPATKVVVVVGQIMSIADEIEDPENTNEFKALKRNLYNSVSGLVAAAKQAANPLAPPDALRQMMTSIQAVVNSVRQLVIGAKNLVAKKEQAENDSLLADLQGVSSSPKTEEKPQISEKKPDSKPLVKKGDDSDEEEVIPVRRHTNTSKLANFFGEAPPTPNSKINKFFGLPTSTEQLPPKVPAYLRHDYKSNELVFTMEGRVKGGTLPALIERLTQHNVVDTEFLNCFLLTFKSFTKAEVVLDLVIKRFYVEPPSGLSQTEINEFNEKKLTPIRLRVVNVLKTWLEAYYEDFDDQNNFRVMYNFVNKDLAVHLKTPSEQLLKLIQKKVSGTMSRKMVFSGQAPLPVISKSISSNKIKFLDLDPLEIARQLTLMESKIFNQISSSEFLGKAWSSPDPSVSPHIRQLIERANELTAFVVESILQEDTPKKRWEMIKHFILVAEKCRSLNNFNSLMNILAGLSSAPIHRLKRTWSQNSKAKPLLDNLRLLMDSSSNFSRYRDALHSVNPPCVPFLGVYLTDLTFIEDGNPSILKGTSLINFDKRNKVAAVIQEVQQYQIAQYCLQAVVVIEKYLIDRFKNAQSIDELYDLSLRLEPRESNDETVLRLLSQSGLA